MAACTNSRWRTDNRSKTYAHTFTQKNSYRLIHETESNERKREKRKKIHKRLNAFEYTIIKKIVDKTPEYTFYLLNWKALAVYSEWLLALSLIFNGNTHTNTLVIAYTTRIISTPIKTVCHQICVCGSNQANNKQKYCTNASSKGIKNDDNGTSEQKISLFFVNQ